MQKLQVVISADPLDEQRPHVSTRNASSTLYGCLGVSVYVDAWSCLDDAAALVEMMSVCGLSVTLFPAFDEDDALAWCWDARGTCDR